MSAFLCTPKHIATLADVSVSPDAARELAIENLTAVEYRYDLTSAAMDAFGIDNDEYARACMDAMPDPTLSTVAKLKLLHAYEYQSCEAPDWAESNARRLCDDIRYTLIARLPGYDNAPWSI